ncbi:MAG: DUF2997 domain-containing protein [Planctomycetes bacterium]|nr:DUF2997 domain-containing protein [Planctomycetota bacterium]
MAEKVELEVEISPTGEVKLAVKGVKGKSCVDLTLAFEKAVGEVKDRKFTPDYYQAAKAVQVRRTK